MSQNAISKQNGKKAYISWLRLTATVSVVLLHVCSTLTENQNLFPLTEKQLVFFNILQNLCRWAVPCFFMMTGALLLDREEAISIKTCLCKYVRRPLLALVIFGVPFGLLMLIFNERTFDFQMVLKSIVMVINGESFAHLWYLYTLIALMLIFPLLQLVVRQGSRKLLYWLMGMIFVFDFCAPYLNRWLGFSIAFSFPIGMYAVLYMLLGFCLSRGYFDRVSNNRPLMLTGILLGVAAVIAADFSGGAAPYVLEYRSPLCLLCAFCMFSLFRQIRAEGRKLLWRLDRLCFGVYLIHPLFIQFSYRFLNITPVRSPAYPLLTGIFAVAFLLLSFGASWVMSLIAPLKKYVL